MSLPPELDFDVSWRQKTKFHNSSYLPETIRALLIGSSECGKTTLLFRLLLAPKVLDYDSLYVFSKSLNQNEYELLVEGYKNKLTKETIRAIFENQEAFKDHSIKDICSLVAAGMAERNKGNITISAFNSRANTPDPSLLDSKKKNLMIFDDIMSENNQSAVESYFTRGRHNAC